MPIFRGPAGCSVQTKQNTGTVRVKCAGDRTAARIRSILTSRRLTLNQVSAESERLYGSGSLSSIPHTLYHSLENSPLFGPSLLQTCTLSRISGYRLEDWLAAVGIDMKELAGLQASLPFGRTRLIDLLLMGRCSQGVILKNEESTTNCALLPLWADYLAGTHCRRHAHQATLRMRARRCSRELVAKMFLLFRNCCRAASSG